MERQNFAEVLINWYQTNKRDLPWRHTRNPYFIWLSEVILQQTRVKQGLPYYYRFVEAYPTVHDLANADEKDVLRLWQGLGYYSRARNMHLTAKSIQNEFNGNFPDNYADLLKLKGIGTYTAAAIASFAYNENAAVVDGNVFRVLARVFGEETDITSTLGKKTFSSLASKLLPNGQAATYNQAIMEFGAIKCTPTSPDCMFCPLAYECVANLKGLQSKLPVKAKKLSVRPRFFHYFVIQQGEKLYLKERVDKDIWRGLFDFYLLEASSLQNLEELSPDLLLKKLINQGVVEHISATYTHVLSHQRLSVRFWHIQIPEGISLLEFSTIQPYELNEVKSLPKPILIDNYLNERFF